ncbi:hypothetical protein [Paraburkholderia sp. BR14374]|uniref:hypothetical protein n=1 Tax=Paraburkholderia sp. BR14374 TaxID=3237007 RepID=UPI0034CE1A19
MIARRLEAPLVTRDVNLIRRAEHSLSSAAQSFIELLVQAHRQAGRPVARCDCAWACHTV